MRGLVALFRREIRDARWHLASWFLVAALAPGVAHAWPLFGGDDEHLVTIGGRVIVPVLFALFAAATASDLVARDVATRRIEALAVLPVPVSRVWTAKALFLLVASLAFLAWSVAAQFAVAAAVASPVAFWHLADNLVAAIPSLLGGLALGAASLFFSTLLERGMAAGLAALVVLVAIAAGVQWTAIPAAPGAAATIAYYTVPLLLAAAFVAASRTAFVRGPIHATSKWRLAYVAIGALAAVAVPAGAAAALGLEGAAHLAPGAGDPLRREACVSPDGKWVAVEDSDADGASRTWLVGVDDGSCRPIADGQTWFVGDDAWLPGGTLRVWTSSFSVVDGPRHIREFEIEPTHLDVVEEHWIYDEYAARRAGVTDLGLSSNVVSGGRRVVVRDGDVTLVSADGTPLRRLFPPKER